MTDNVWLYEQIPNKEQFVFDKNDYEVYLNPTVLSETVDIVDLSVSYFNLHRKLLQTLDESKHDEYNQSFPLFKASIARPQEIEVEYSDENSNNVTK